MNIVQLNILLSYVLYLGIFILQQPTSPKKTVTYEQRQSCNTLMEVWEVVFIGLLNGLRRSKQGRWANILRYLTDPIPAGDNTKTDIAIL